MKYFNIILAIVLTLGMLVIARMTSRGQPEPIHHTENGITFDMMSVPKWKANNLARIPVTITGAVEKGLIPQIRISKFGQDDKSPLHRYSTIPLLIEDKEAGKFYTEISTGTRGKRIYFYLEVRDRVGRLGATLIPEPGNPYVLKFIGDVPPFVLYGHILLMFVTVFFIMMAAVNAVQLIRGGDNVRPMAVSLFAATVSTFLGCYPFGFGMNWYAFAVIWEGVPFGTDATDNKTQLLFVYLVFTVLTTIGSLTRGKIGRDLFKPKALGWIGLGGLAMMLSTYLIPHSIQFAPELTYRVCYSFIGLVAIWYLYALITATKRLKPAGGKARSKKIKKS